MKRKHAKGRYGSKVKLTEVKKKGRSSVWRLRFVDKDTGEWKERTFRDYDEARALYDMYDKGHIDDALAIFNMVAEGESVVEMFAIRLWRKFGKNNNLLQHTLQYLYQHEDPEEVKAFATDLLSWWKDALTDTKEQEIKDLLGSQLSVIADHVDITAPKPPPAGISLDDAMAQYRKERQLMLDRGQCQPAHHKNVLHELDKWQQGWTNRELSSITAAEINDKLDSFRYQGKPLSNTSKYRYRGTLNAFFLWAIQHDLIQKNPVSLTVAPSRDHISIGILTPGEFRKLLEAALKYDRPMLSRIVLQGLCGLRRSEVVQYKDKPDGHDDIFVSREIARGPKGKTKDRYIPTSPQIKAWLAAGEWEPMTRDDELRYGYRLDQLAAKAGITIPKNALRHSFASYQAALHPLPDVARWMGHSGTQMTESHYRQGVSRKDAEAYLSIIPDAVS